MFVICSMDLKTLNVKCKQPPVLLVAGPKRLFVCFFNVSYLPATMVRAIAHIMYGCWMHGKCRVLYHFELNASTMFITQSDLRISIDIICSAFFFPAPIYAQNAVQWENEHFQIEK